MHKSYKRKLGTKSTFRIITVSPGLNTSAKEPLERSALEDTQQTNGLDRQQTDRLSRSQELPVDVQAQERRQQEEAAAYNAGKSWVIFFDGKIVSVLCPDVLLSIPS